MQTQGSSEKPVVENTHRTRAIVAKIAIARNQINTPRGGPIEQGGSNIHIQQKKTCSAIAPSPLCHHAHQPGPHFMCCGQASGNHSSQASRARNLQAMILEVGKTLKNRLPVTQCDTSTWIGKVRVLSRMKATHQPFGLGQ